MGGGEYTGLPVLTQLPPPLLGVCPAHMPGGRQSRAETWSQLSDSIADTSGKKWLAPTGEMQSGPSLSQSYHHNCLIAAIVSSQEWDEVSRGGHPAGHSGEG